MKRLKKLLCLTLAMVMTLSLCVTSFAVEPESDYPEINQAAEEEIDRLISLLVQQRMQAWGDEASATNQARTLVETQNSNEAALLSAIEALGARQVDKEYVNNLGGNQQASGVAPRYSEHTSVHENYFITGPYSMNVSGTIYYYVFLRVVPKNSSSVLSGHELKNVFEPEEIPLMDFAFDYCSLHARKMIIEAGLSAFSWYRVLQWFPYDILFEDFGNAQIQNTYASYQITTNSATTVKYAYVTDGNPNDEEQYEITLTEHSVDVTELHATGYTENGDSNIRSEVRSHVVLGTYYSMPQELAIDNYIAYDYDFMEPPGLDYHKGGDISGPLIGTITPKRGYQDPSGY